VHTTDQIVSNGLAAGLGPSASLRKIWSGAAMPCRDRSAPQDEQWLEGKKIMSGVLGTATAEDARKRQEALRMSCPMAATRPMAVRPARQADGSNPAGYLSGLCERPAR